SRSTHHLPLRNFVHGIDVVHPFDSIQIPLMDRIHAQVTWPSIRLWSPPFANGHLGRPSGLIGYPSLPVRESFSQPVHLRHRQFGQTPVLQFPKIVVGPL